MLRDEVYHWGARRAVQRWRGAYHRGVKNGLPNLFSAPLRGWQPERNHLPKIMYAVDTNCLTALVGKRLSFCSKRLAPDAFWVRFN